MLISGVTAEDLEAAREVASEALGNELVFSEFVSKSATRHAVRLQVANLDGPGARRHSMSFHLGFTKTPRRSRFACTHAYAHLCTAIFERTPEAYVKTALATYHGAAGFLRTFEGVMHRNIGSTLLPIDLADECTCLSDDVPTDTIEDWHIGVSAMPNPSNTRTVA